MNKIFPLLISIVLTSIGLLFTLIYLNLLTMGYTFWDYVYFIIRRIECDFLFIGIFLFLILIRKRAKTKWIITMIF